MPRRLIIGVLILLILGIVGGTVVLVVQRLRGEDDTDATTPGTTPGTLQPASVGNQNITNPTGDDDSDGLSNADEALWNTNRTNADTDGDGFQDGEEVTGNHNPTVAGPNDLLPAGFKPGLDIEPLDVSDSAPIAVDQYFKDNLDLSGGNRNLTEAYRATYSEADRTPDTLQTFVNTQPIVTNLPRPVERVLVFQPTDTPLVMSEYMGIAGDLSVFSDRDLLLSALDKLYTDNDASLIMGLASSVRAHQRSLLEQTVPPAAANLHKLLLGYTELVAATYEQMAKYNEDQVKSLVGMHQLQEIDEKYIPLLQQETRRLNALSAQLNGQTIDQHEL